MGSLLGPTPPEAKSGEMELGSNYGRSSIIEMKSEGIAQVVDDSGNPLAPPA